VGNVELEDRQIATATALVTCRGRLNMATAPEFRSYLNAVIDDGSSHVVVDLAETSFIDSSGLGALIGVLKRARSEGGDLRIATPSEQVRMVLGLTNLDRVLRPHESLDEATRGW
jgi:anti-sigma B factor antagonist